MAAALRLRWRERTVATGRNGATRVAARPATIEEAGVRRIGRTALALLVVSGTVSYVDRATLAVANPLIRHDLGVGVAQMGWLLSAFLWAYAFAQLPAGVLLDRIGPRRVLPAGLVLWSFAQAAGGLVTGFVPFVVARMALGIGESPVSPGSARVVRDWFPVERRGTATGIWNCSSTLGTALSTPLITVLMLDFGWRATFAIMGAVGLVVAGVFAVLHRDRRDVVLAPDSARRLAAGDPAACGPQRLTRADWLALLRHRSTWGMLAGFFGCIYVLWIYNAWLPGYLEIDRHMSIRHTGWVAAVPALFGVLGSLAGGRLVDRLARAGWSPIDSRRWPLALSLLGVAACTVGAALVASNALAVALISLALFLVYVCTSAAWAMPSVIAPAHVTASLGAMQNSGGYIGGALAPAVTGMVVAHTGSFQAALLAGAAIAVVAAVLHLALVRRPITLEPAGG